MFGGREILEEENVNCKLGPAVIGLFFFSLFILKTILKIYIKIKSI